jgi:hypothetical protein
MQLVTNVEGYKLVNTQEIENAFQKMREMEAQANALRMVLIKDIKMLQDRDKNSFAKTIRLIDKFTKTLIITEIRL